MSRPSTTLVYDRTLADVTSNTSKGNYNASDLNRIESWCAYLAETLNTYGYYVSITTKTDWAIGLGKSNMTTEINRIKNNLTSLKNAFYTLSTTPSVPSTTDTSINYTKANNMEKIIKDIDYLITSMTQYFVHSGSGAVAGMDRVFNNAFRRY